MSIQREFAVPFTPDEALLDAISTDTQRGLDRHLVGNDHEALAPREPGKPVDELSVRSQRKAWLPSEIVPWDLARPIDHDTIWTPEAVRSHDEDYVPSRLGRTALLVGGLTEENLPGYFSEISRFLSEAEPYRTWSPRWTAEEHKHGAAISGYVNATWVVDPRTYEAAVFRQMSGMEVPRPETTMHGLVYVRFQEKFTQVTHANNGKLLDRDGQRLFRHLASDESNHTTMYTLMSAAAHRHDPSGYIVAARDIIRDFNMPGTGIANFSEHTERLALGGVLGPEHYATVFEKALSDPQTVNIWSHDDADLTPQAAAARREIVTQINKYKFTANALQKRRERLMTGEEQSDLFEGIILGQTHHLADGRLEPLPDPQLGSKLERLKFQDYRERFGQAA